jgi:hypothetical protein
VNCVKQFLDLSFDTFRFFGLKFSMGHFTYNFNLACSKLVTIITFSYMITKWSFFNLGILSCPHVLTHLFLFARAKLLWWLEMVKSQGVKIIKPNVWKVYRLGANVIGGFASSLVTTFLPIQQVSIVILNWKNLYLDCSQSKSSSYDLLS